MHIGLYGDVLQVVALSGAFSARDVSALRRVCQDLSEAGQSLIVLDFTEVESIDGFALASLASLMSRLRPGGGRLALIAVNPDIRQLFARVHLDLVFPVYATLAQAMEKAKKA